MYKFVAGMAGSNKSLLASRLIEWHSNNDAYAAALRRILKMGEEVED